MPKTWASFEDRVRSLASEIWSSPCEPRNVGGVALDGVVESSADVWIFIEITERRELSKVREDVIKLQTAKSALMQEKGIFARCFCIVNGPITRAMSEAGEPHQIQVRSFDAFSKTFFDFESYKSLRKNISFGSAIDPVTGELDKTQYISVRYKVDGQNKELNINEIAGYLNRGKSVILLGEYGTGKSRCIRELFLHMSTNATERQFYPIAIDLREAWGVKRGRELLRRHLEDIGAENLNQPAIRALNLQTLALLIDGFDEIGSQTWSNNTEKLRTIRSKSLEGVKDLISKSKSSVFISGREHYFNSNDEMFSALGLSPSETIVLRCKTEFTEDETKEFFQRLQEEIQIPSWLPRRPLICQTIANLSESDLDSMFISGKKETDFWEHFIDILCQRDARIHISFDPTTIKKILIRLSRITRSKSANVGLACPIEVAGA
ncbi:NACHT domain-containing protein [Amorphus sp. MBR-141]